MFFVGWWDSVSSIAHLKQTVSLVYCVWCLIVGSPAYTCHSRVSGCISAQRGAMYILSMWRHSLYAVTPSTGTKLLKCKVFSLWELLRISHNAIIWFPKEHGPFITAPIRAKAGLPKGLGWAPEIRYILAFIYNTMQRQIIINSKSMVLAKG